MTGSMSQTRLRAWWTLGVWAVAGVGFAMVFFAWGGPAAFGEESVRVLAGAIPIALGYAGYLLAMWVTRARGGVVVTDERDAAVVARAFLGTLIVVHSAATLVVDGRYGGG